MFDFLKGIYYGVLEFDPYSICFAVLIIIIVLCLVRAMINVALFAIVACAILIGVLEYSPEEIYYKAEQMMNQAKETAKKHVEPILLEQLKNADVKYQDDGSYEILVSEVRITGKKGESKVNIYFKNEELKIDIGEFDKEVNQLLTNISEGKDVSISPTKTEG